MKVSSLFLAAALAFGLGSAASATPLPNAADITQRSDVTVEYAKRHKHWKGHKGRHYGWYKPRRVYYVAPRRHYYGYYPARRHYYGYYPSRRYYGYGYSPRPRTGIYFSF